MAKNLSIVAQGISGDEGHLLGYNVTDNGIYTPAIGDVVRGTSATYVAQDGLIKTAPPNVARVDYTNGVSELLLEPSASNFLTYSSDIINNIASSSTSSKWNRYFTTTQGGFEDSMGGQNAVQVSSDGSSNAHVLSYRLSSVPNGSFSVSIPKSQKFICLSAVLSSNSNGVGVIYDLENKSIEYVQQNSQVTDYDFKVVSYGDKYRVSLIWESSLAMDIFSVSCYNGGSYTWNSATKSPSFGSGSVVISEPQIEGVVPTSYIPTQSTLVTRSADSLTNFGGTQIIDSVSGILFFEGSSEFDNTYISINNATASNRIFIYFSDNKLIAKITIGGSTTTTLLGASNTAKINNKYAFKYSSGDLELFMNGTSVFTQNKIYSMPILDRLEFNGGVGLTPFYGRVRQVKHLPYNTDISKL